MSDQSTDNPNKPKKNSFNPRVVLASLLAGMTIGWGGKEAHDRLIPVVAQRRFKKHIKDDILRLIKDDKETNRLIGAIMPQSDLLRQIENDPAAIRNLAKLARAFEEDAQVSIDERMKKLKDIKDTIPQGKWAKKATQGKPSSRGLFGGAASE